MEWRDVGILLNTREHGESSAILDVLTSAHGRHAGIVRGARGSKFSAAMQPGAQLSVEWRARMEDHLGNYRIEPIKSRASMLMEDRTGLAAFNAMSALILQFVPEREADYDFYDATHELVEDLCTRPRGWPGSYAFWELVFLSAVGFGLDLDRCAATGTRRDLAYISPRTGRAVSRETGGPWADKLLPLAPFLTGDGTVTMAGVRSALYTSGWFLENRVCPAMERESLPEARDRLVRLFERYELAPRPKKADGSDDRRESWYRRIGVVRQVPHRA